MLRDLQESIMSLGGVAVGFSGGVDSSVVAGAAMQALGPGKVIAVTADSETLPASELEAAGDLAARLNIPHFVIRTHELECEEFVSNPPDRCFYCKSELWQRVRVLADEHGLPSLADGVNADDLSDHRPGIRASDEAGVAHPLAEIGAGKEDVRRLAQALGLPNWDKPAQACLSSRFPYGERLSVAGLRRVEAAEDFLRQMSLTDLRVRSHGDIARIEVPPACVPEVTEDRQREKIVSFFRSLGFYYVTLDLQGLRSGSLNEPLAETIQPE